MNAKVKDILRNKSGPAFFAIDFGATLLFAAVPASIALEVLGLGLGVVGTILLSGFVLSRIIMSAVIKSVQED